jgi:type I restriction enzyme, R subunit
MSTEAKARIKINQLLAESGWRFFNTPEGNANIVLEGSVKITQKHLNEAGEDFEKTKKGFMDYLLLGNKGFPIAVLEAKKESIDPLSAKEQVQLMVKQ